MRYVCAAIALAAGGCGSVKGSCPGDSNDGIDCTADICDLNTNQWVHLPDNGACGPGQVCTANGGCEASALTGSAFLLGHDAADPAHDHSGITVTLLLAGGSGSATGSGSASAAGPTATTAPDGSWSISVEPGSYTVQYSKDKYFSATTPGVVVGAAGGGVAPAVTLTHYQEYNANTEITSSGSPETTDNYLLTFSDGAFGTSVYSTPLDGSTDAVPLFGGDYDNLFLSATYAVWTSNDGGVVWSRPLDGSAPPVKLHSVASAASVSIVGTVGTYTIMYEVSSTTSLGSLWVAKTDGSVIPTMPAWTQTDANHAFQSLVNNDATALFFTQDINNGTPPTDPAATEPAHRIDLASNATSAVSVGTASSGLSGGLYPSPDGNWAYGVVTAYNGATAVERGFIASITASPPSSLIALSTTALTGNYSDAGTSILDWLPDSTAFVFESEDAGDLREWKTSMAAATSIVSAGGFDDLAWFGDIIIYQAADDSLHAYGLADNTTYVIDGSATGYGEHNVLPTVESTGELYAVITENDSNGNPAKAIAVDFPAGVSVSGASSTTLFTSIPSGCDYNDALSDTTYYQYCYDSGTLTAYPKLTSTPSFQLPGLLTSAQDADFAELLAAAPQAESIVFPMADLNLYSVSNMAAGDVVPALVASKFDPAFAWEAIGNWLLYGDSANALTRASNVDGSVIDEPLDTCEMFAEGLLTDTTGMRIWAPAAYCGDKSPPRFQEAMLPVANLP